MGLDYRQIGQRIAARRRQLGLRQTQVCERCDINSNYNINFFLYYFFLQQLVRFNFS